MPKENPPYWEERLAKLADAPRRRGLRGPSPFGQKSLPALVPVNAWDGFENVQLDPKHLTRHRILNGDQKHPAQAPFDVLRTKLVQMLRDNGWSRVAITSPTKGCGKTFVAANLALSLARRDASRTVLIDMDLRDPGLAKTLGITHPGRLRHYLAGKLQARDYFLKIGDNLVVGLNSKAESEAAEILQTGKTREMLETMQEALQPDVVLYDMPPALQNDDVLSFLPQVDGVLMVVGGGKTKASDVHKVERMLGTQVPLLGVILNRDEGFTFKG